MQAAVIICFIYRHNFLFLHIFSVQKHLYMCDIILCKEHIAHAELCPGHSQVAGIVEIMPTLLTNQMTGIFR